MWAFDLLAFYHMVVFLVLFSARNLVKGREGILNWGRRLFCWHCITGVYLYYHLKSLSNTWYNVLDDLPAHVFRWETESQVWELFWNILGLLVAGRGKFLSTSGPRRITRGTVVGIREAENGLMGQGSKYISFEVKWQHMNCSFFF